MELKKVTRLIVAIGIAVSLNAPALAWQAGKKPAAANKIVAYLEKLGYKYTKVSDNVWEIPFTGKNLSEFPVRITIAGGDLILVLTKLADRSAVNLSGGFAVKLLELNDTMDTVKFALSEDMLYARLELHERVVDQQELKYMLEQISGAVDEAYPQIKAFLSK
jgi:hypothetical protein